jgi:hypothetical protein
MTEQTTTTNQPTILIVEKSGPHLWGRTTINDNLIVSVALNLEGLQKIMKKLIRDFEQVEVNSFEIVHED